MDIQFIGCGKMGSIILENLISTGINPSCIYVKTNTTNSENKITQKYNVKSGINNSSNIVFICVKPINFNDLDLSIFGENTLFISIMAGVTIKSILLKIKSKNIIRCMPNTPMSIGKGVIGYFKSNEVSTKKNNFFKEIFSKSGELIKLKNEDEIDKITALSGSGPAYYFYFTETIKNKALEFGFSENDSVNIANNTFIGSAELLKKSNLDIFELRKNITSKGGTTQKAIETFEKNNFSKNVEEAIESAYNKAKELNK